MSLDDLYQFSVSNVCFAPGYLGLGQIQAGREVAAEVWLWNLIGQINF